MRFLKLTILWFAFYTFLRGFTTSFEQLFLLRVPQGLVAVTGFAVVILVVMLLPETRGKTLPVYD